MTSKPSPLSAWPPDEIARAREWVDAWRLAGRDLDRIRQEELRRLDTYTAISWLCGPANYHEEPRAPKPTSGLVEQQRLFQRLRTR
jgi:hypothetical protein